MFLVIAINVHASELHFSEKYKIAVSNNLVTLLFAYIVR